MGASKAARVWKRTWVGALIAAALALILWAASAFSSALPVLGASLAILGVCIREVAGMGSFRGRRLGWSLGFGAAWVGLTTLPWLASQTSRDGGAAGLDRGHFWLFTCALEAPAAIAIAYAFARSSSIVVKVAAALAAAGWLLPLGGAAEWRFFVTTALILFVIARLVLIGAERRFEALGAIGLGSVLVVSVPGLAVAWLEFEHVGLIALVAIAKLGDTAAYYAGSAIGKHHPFKSISPGKTTEGCAASFVAACMAGGACVPLGLLPSEPYGWLGGCAAGAVVNVAAQASDLLESWVKRKAGVKDSGAWFGPSGGMLDLVDSFFLATPAALLAWPLMLEFPSV